MTWNDTHERFFELALFIDFDGTITTTDIGFDLFNKLSSQEPWHAMLMNGTMDITDYWRNVVRAVREPLTEERILEYLRTIPVDPGLDAFMQVVQEEKLPLTIVSDGLSSYIRPYLELHGVPVQGEAHNGYPLYCNDSRLDGEGRLHIRFTHQAEGCECLSAVCKRNVVLCNAPPETRIVYIGDGVSDLCAAEHADIIFAKGNLAAFCNERKLPHYPYKTLEEVAVQLRKLLGRRRLKPRHQAELLRRKAWEAE